MARLSNQSVANIAAAAAGFMIASQIAAKAIRDALFLSTIGIEWLPTMIMVAAVVGMIAVLPAGQLLRRFSPWRVMPVAFGVSAVLLIGEWILVLANPIVGAVLLYLHFAALGAILISGFWTAMSERFDARAARSLITRVSTGATLGGVVGAVVADRVAAWTAATSILLVLAGLHLVAAILTWACRPGVGDVGADVESDPEDSDSGSWSWLASLQNIGRVGYLRNLALVVALSAAAAVLVDYVFKAAAVEVFTDEQALTQFFARFYAGVAIATFVFQSIASRPLLERLGIARTVGLLPVIVGLGIATGLIFPVLAVLTAARGSEAVLRSSVFKSGYELVYTPIPPDEKRASKTIVDVAFDRMGDIAGATMVQIALFLPVIAVSRVLLGAGLALMVGLLFAARNLQKGYVTALERGLRDRGMKLDLQDVFDFTTRSTVMRVRGPTPSEPETSETPNTPPPRSGPEQRDEVVELLAQLRCGELEQVQRALSQASTHGRYLAGPMIMLLAWDEAADAAIRELRQLAPRIEGQLLDMLRDRETSFAVRRRLPMVLGDSRTQPVLDALSAAMLDERRFEIRFNCAQALARLHRKAPDLRVDKALVTQQLLGELDVNPEIWDRRQLIDDTLRREFLPGFVNSSQKVRRPSLEHVFNLLRLLYPEEPLRVAWHGIGHTDTVLRGLALEYLDSVLPDDVAEALWPFVESKALRAQTKRSPSAILTELTVESSRRELVAAADSLEEGA